MHVSDAARIVLGVWILTNALHKPECGVACALGCAVLERVRFGRVCGCMLLAFGIAEQARFCHAFYICLQYLNFGLYTHTHHVFLYLCAAYTLITLHVCTCATPTRDAACGMVMIASLVVSIHTRMK